MYIDAVFHSLFNYFSQSVLDSFASAAFKIIAASLGARSNISSSIERTAQLAAKCQIKDLYNSVITNFSGKESQMKRKQTFKLL